MKITKELVFLIAVIVAGAVGMVLGLAVWANWSDGAIFAMISLFASLASGLIVAVRNQQKTTENLEHADDKLNTLIHQTNAMSGEEQQEIAERAAAAVVRQFRGERL